MHKSGKDKKYSVFSIEGEPIGEYTAAEEIAGKLKTNAKCVAEAIANGTIIRGKFYVFENAKIDSAKINPSSKPKP